MWQKYSYLYRELPSTSESVKCKNMNQSFLADGDVVSYVVGVCLTRWCIRTKAISRIFHRYGPFLGTRVKITSLHKQAMKGNFFLSFFTNKHLRSTRVPSGAHSGLRTLREESMAKEILKKSKGM